MQDADFQAIFGVDSGFPARQVGGQFIRIYLESEPINPPRDPSLPPTRRRYLLVISPGDYKAFNLWRASFKVLTGNATLTALDESGQPTGSPVVLAEGQEVVNENGMTGPAKLTVAVGGVVVIVNLLEAELSYLDSFYTLASSSGSTLPSSCSNKPCDKPPVVPGLSYFS